MYVHIYILTYIYAHIYVYMLWIACSFKPFFSPSLNCQMELYRATSISFSLFALLAIRVFSFIFFLFLLFVCSSFFLCCNKEWNSMMIINSNGKRKKKNEIAISLLSSFSFFFLLQKSSLHFFCCFFAKMELNRLCFVIVLLLSRQMTIFFPSLSLTHCLMFCCLMQWVR